MTRIITRSLAFAFLVPVLSQCAKRTPAAESADGSEPLAVVAGQPITEADLREEAGWRQRNRQPVPAPEVLLEEMVRRRAILEQARQEGFDRDPETRRRMESILIAGLRQRELDPKVDAVDASDGEVRAAYEERADEFTRKGVDRFAVLFQAVPSSASAERKAEARERLEQGLARAASDPAPGGRGPAATGFGAVAIDCSDDQVSRYRGGDIGWVESDATESLVPAPVLAAGRSLGKGETSDILETDQGYYVIMKSDARPGGRLDFEEVADRLRQQLLAEKRRTLEEQFVDAAYEAAGVTLDLEAARKIDLPRNARPAPADEGPPDFPGISRSDAR